MKKKHKFHKNNKLQILQNNIIQFKQFLPEKSNEYTHHSIYSHSWFQLTEKNYKNVNNPNNVNIELFCQTPKKPITKCIKIKVFPTEQQRNILKLWMDAYITMYNETIKLFRNKRFNNEKITLSWTKIRDLYMKDIKYKLIKQTSIDSHSINGAIQDACTSYKSALTNIKEGHIKHFRIRYIKYTKARKVLKIEAPAFSKKYSTFCISQLGKNIKTENNYDLSKIKRDCKLHYDTNTNRMTLLVPSECQKYKKKENKKKENKKKENKKKENKKKENKKNDYISLDPGIRCFLTGYTANKDIKIGENIYKKVKHHLEKIDKVRINIEEKKRKKIERKQNYRIKSKIEDMHWKVIKYLIENNKQILIGNLSTKDIVKKREGELNKMVKRVGLSMNLYKFKQKLEYKCGINEVKYKEIDESYTSKVCSNCGNYKKDLGSAKVYKCKRCKVELDRDINGSKNILVNGISSIRLGPVAVQ